MSTARKRTLLLVVLSMIMLMYLSAGTYYVDWTPGLYYSGASFLRYKINGGNWKTVDPESDFIKSVVYGKNNNLVIESSADGETWDNTVTAKLKVIEPGSSDQYQLSWQWNMVPGADAVRYNRDNGQWIYLGTDKDSITEELIPNTLTVTHVQSSSGDVWYDGIKKGFFAAEKQPIPKTRILMISILGGVEFEDVYYTYSKTSLRSSLGWGGKLTLSLPVTNSFALSIDNQASLFTLGRYRYIQYDPSIKLRFSPYTEKGITPYFMVGGGVSMVIRESRFFFYPLVSLDLGFDYWFSKSFALSINACASATVQQDTVLNPGVLIDSIGLHASGSIGFTYAICKKGEAR